MKGTEVIHRLPVSAVLLPIGTSLALAQPFTRRSSQLRYDELKKAYEIANFRLGGR
jgi:hypothetical protein